MPNMLDDIEFQQHYHKSKYAGISVQERDGIRELRNEIKAQRKARLMLSEFLQKDCARCSPRSGISGILDANTSWDVKAVAKGFGIIKRPFESRARLAERALAVMQADEDLVHACIAPLSMSMIDGLSELYYAGGVMNVDTNALDLPTALPPLYLPLVCYPFCNGGMLTLVMPEETRAIFQAVGFQKLHDAARERWRIVHLAEAMAFLHGIIPLETAVSMLQSVDASLVSEEGRTGFFDTLLMMAYANTLDACLLVTSDDAYLADKSLACQNLFLGVKPEPSIGVIPNLGPFLSWIEEEQHSFSPRPLEPGMNDCESVMRWMLHIPAMQEILAYFDLHVPDREDDFWYAEDLAQDVLRAVLKLSPIDDGKEIIARKLEGYEVDIYGGIREPYLMELFTMASETVPRWMCRGWAKADLQM